MYPMVLEALVALYDQSIWIIRDVIRFVERVSSHSMASISSS